MEIRKPTELENINTFLKMAARERLYAPVVIKKLQERRMEVIAGSNWQERINNWIFSGEEFKTT